MTQYKSYPSRSLILVALCEIIGGLVGIGFCLWAFGRGALPLAFAFLTALSLLSVLAGLLLLVEDPRGRLLSFIVLGLQVVQVESSVLSYVFKALPLGIFPHVNVAGDGTYNVGITANLMPVSFSLNIPGEAGFFADSTSSPFCYSGSLIRKLRC